MWGRMYGIVHLFRVPTLSYGIFPELSFVGAMYSRSNKSKVVRLEWFESCDRWNVFTFARIVSAFDYRLRGIHLNATRTRRSYELPTLCSTTTSLIHLYCFCLSPPSSFTPFPLPPIFATTKRPPLLLPVEKYQTPAHLCRAQGNSETRQTGTQRSPQRAEVFGCPGKSSACQVVPGLTLFLVDEIINQDYSRWNYKSGSIQVT